MEIFINKTTCDAQEALELLYDLYEQLSQVKLSMVQNGASIKVEIKSNKTMEE